MKIRWNMSTMKRALSWCLLQLLVLALHERWQFFQEDASFSTSARHILKQRLSSRPIIGILSQARVTQSLTFLCWDSYNAYEKFDLVQELGKKGLAANFGASFSSHIPAQYVKFLEAAGARVVPIMIDREPGGNIRLIGPWQLVVITKLDFCRVLRKDVQFNKRTVTPRWREGIHLIYLRLTS